MLRDAAKFASGIDVAGNHDLFSEAGGATPAVSDSHRSDCRDNIGTQFTATASGIIEGDAHFAKQEGQLVYAASEGMYHSVNAAGDGPDDTGAGTPIANLLTAQIEAVQAKINAVRVQAGSQYAALESAVNYTTTRPLSMNLDIIRLMM